MPGISAKWVTILARVLCCCIALVVFGVATVFYVAKLVALYGINGFGYGLVLPALVTAVGMLPLGYIVVVLARRLIRRRDHDVLPDALWAMAAVPVGLAGLFTAGIFLFGGF